MSTSSTRIGACSRSRSQTRGATRALPLLLCLALAAGCSNLRVTTDFDPDFAFSELRTYAWLPGPGPQEQSSRVHNSLVDSRVRNAVDAQLSARGFEQVAVASADFLVVHHVGLETGIDVQTIHTTHRYGRSRWHSTGPTWSAGSSRTVVREYERGTLLIDILLPADRSLLWRGSTSSRIRGASTPEQRERRIQEAVEQILKRFPPG